MLHGFWAGVVAGVIGTVLPSLIVFAALLKRAPEIEHHSQVIDRDEFTVETTLTPGGRT